MIWLSFPTFLVLLFGKFAKCLESVADCSFKSFFAVGLPHTAHAHTRSLKQGIGNDTKVENVLPFAYTSI